MIETSSTARKGYMRSHTFATMTGMRHVGVREFKDQATTMLASGETLVIERHGTPIGFYIPIEAKDRASGRVALDRLGDAVADVLTATGLSEEGLVDELAPTRRSRTRR